MDVGEFAAGRCLAPGGLIAPRTDHLVPEELRFRTRFRMTASNGLGLLCAGGEESVRLALRCSRWL